jgi:outer membrane protein assembly factor BamB
MSALLLALLLQAQDAVVTRDGRRLEGRVLQYGQTVELEGADGRRTRVYPYEVARIDPGGDYPRCPEVLTFPPDLLEKIEYDYASYRRVLVAIPRQAGKKIIGVDVAAAKRLWELEVPDLLVPPVVAGSAIHFVQIQKELDESRKLKFGGSAMAKEVHRISIKAVDLETCETRWTHTFDNNDRRDVFWTVASNPAPTLHFLPDRITLRIAKDAWPVDSMGNCDKTRPQNFASFVSYDPQQKRLLASVDSPDAAEAGGRPWFTPDLAVLQVFTTAVSWKLVAIGLRDGKKKWETEGVTGTLHDIGDEWAYASDVTHFHAISLKTGKRLEKWSLETTGGQVSEVEGGFAYLYRGRKAPKQIEVFDLKKGAVAFKIPMPEDDEFVHQRIIGNRLIYTDRLNRIHAFDLGTRKEAWTWAGTGPTFLQNAGMIGGAFGFYKDGRITLLEPHGGQKVWEVKGAYRVVVPIGDEGFLAIRNPGADLVRRRRFDRPGVFFTPGDVPLRYAWGGDETWAAPAVVDGVLYSLSSGAVALAVGIKDRKVLWSERLSRTPVPLLAPPVVHDGVYTANAGGETQAWALSNRGRLYATRHLPMSAERSFAEQNGLWFACAPGLPLSAVDFASGKRVWDSPARGILHCTAAGDTLHAVSATQYHRIDAKTGAVKDSSPAGRGTTAVAADETRAFLVSGPYGFGVPGAEGVRPRWTSKASDPKIGLRFRGAFALAPEGLVYSHAEGAVAYFKDGSDKPEWTVTTPEFTSALKVHEGRVWFAAPGVGLAGVDLKEGRFVWKSAVADAGLFTPVLWEGRPAFWSADGWLIPVKEE